MARRGRVGQRQPDVERNEPGLGAEADQRPGRTRGCGVPAKQWRRRPQCGEAVSPCRREQQERREQERQAERGSWRDTRFPPAGRRLVRLGDDQEVGRERHAPPTPAGRSRRCRPAGPGSCQEEQVAAWRPADAKRAPAFIDRAVARRRRARKARRRGRPLREEGAEPIQMRTRSRQRAQQRAEIEVEHGAGDEHPSARPDASGAAKHCACRRQPRPSRPWPQEQRGDRAGAIATHHEDERASRSSPRELSAPRGLAGQARSGCRAGCRRARAGSRPRTRRPG